MLDGRKLKALRAVAGMTQAQLAEAAGVSPTAVAEFVSGRRDLRVSTIRKLLKAMRATVHFRVAGAEIS